jgi:hypothetical protein
MRVKRICLALLILTFAGALWLACLHLFFSQPASNFYTEKGLSTQGRQLAARHLSLWGESQLRSGEIEKMRNSNSEWDFMGRTFLVWSLANLSLRDPSSKETNLRVIDQIIDETLNLERQHGMYFFLMPYAKARPYVSKPARSLFLDGEICMMLASRCVVEEKTDYKVALTQRAQLMHERFSQSKTLALESYPDECWMFDHAVGLAALRLVDYLEGTDHSELFRKWLTMAKQSLIHPATGLLISSFNVDLAPLDGPEGSSIWMIAHCLQLLDEDFARDQYQRARKELGRITLGFGYAREWPASWQNSSDIDSGPVIPFFKISAGSSGMAFIGATAFDDSPFLVSLARTLDFAAFPARQESGLKYCASNQVGDAVLLYAATLGPLWEKVKKKL